MLEIAGGIAAMKRAIDRYITIDGNFIVDSWAKKLKTSRPENLAIVGRKHKTAHAAHPI